ncbi:hypothetical protein KCU71_g4900, partial [Aureobasidium melanogenum]
MEDHDATLSWSDRTVLLNSNHCRHHYLRTGGGRPMLAPYANTNSAEPLSVAKASAEEFARLAHNRNEAFAFMYIPTYIDERTEQEAALHIAAMRLEHGDERTEQEAALHIVAMRLKHGDDYQDHELNISAITQADIDKFMTKKPETDVLETLPPQYRQFANMFSKTEADKLPPHRPQDHEICLHDRRQPPYVRPRGMLPKELAATKKYLNENLDKGFIRPSASPAAAPVLLVRKPGGGLRFCINYRGLNDATIKNRYPIPLIRETLDKLAKAKYFSKFNIIAAFNNLRIKEGDEWKTAFNTRYGQYEYLVMPFRLCNALGTFQSYINSALHEYLNDFYTGYLDDILVFSETLEEHRVHVSKVLKRLRQAKLYANIDKSEFKVISTKYLGLIISTNRLKMDPQKIKAVLN